MNTLTREKLVTLLSKEIGINKRESKEIVYSFFDLIKSKLLDGIDVKITGLGLFRLSDKGPRPARNISINQTVFIPPRRVVTFKSGVVLKQKISITQDALLIDQMSDETDNKPLSDQKPLMASSKYG